MVNKATKTKSLESKQWVSALQPLLLFTLQNSMTCSNTTNLLLSISFNIPVSKLTMKLRWHCSRWRPLWQRDVVKRTYAFMTHSLASLLVRRRLCPAGVDLPGITWFKLPGLQSNPRSHFLRQLQHPRLPLHWSFRRILCKRRNLPKVFRQNLLLGTSSGSNFFCSEVSILHSHTFSGGSRMPRRRRCHPSRRGRQHTNLLDFPKNCMK